MGQKLPGVTKSNLKNLSYSGATDHKLLLKVANFNNSTVQNKQHL